MDPKRPNRILDDWAAVANQARRPSTPPYPVVVRSGLPGATLAGASLVVVALLVAGVLLGRQAPNVVVGSSPSTPTVPTASTGPLPTASQPAAASATASAAAVASASAEPTIGPLAPCDPSALAARITLWEGAAGSRIAHVELKNAGSAPCLVETIVRPQLIDGRGSVLIDGSKPTTSKVRQLAPGGVLKSLVADSNYCGPTPLLPVSVAFVLSDGRRVVAKPFSPTDGTLPPCNSAPGSAGTIDMHPWAP